MVGGSPLRLRRAALALALVTALPAQEHARWIADLGDPDRGEAAERALLQLGDKAVRPLQELLDGWDTGSQRDVDRLRGALRVVDLLGESAAPLAAVVTANLKRDAKTLRVELLATRANLYPYANDPTWQELFHQGFHGCDATAQPAAFQTFVRMAARSLVRATQDAAAMRAELEQDRIFAREVAAEALGRLGDADAIELLRARLADRDRRPKGWDQIRHNGFVVPAEDQFRLRASAALVRLAPDDARSAVGYGHLALLHPHRTVRLDALRSLARFGPDVAAAMPELVQVAQQYDAGLAAEALKVLGMAGREVGPHLATIELLHAQSHGAVQKLAGSLAARLRAMGAVAVPEPPEAIAARARDQELAQATAAVSDTPDAAATAAEAKLLQAGTAAWPFLVARYRAEPQGVPDRLLLLLGRVGQHLPEAERQEVRHALASSEGEAWSGPSMSTRSGGGTMREAHREAYARLTMGQPATLEALAEFLNHANASVRLTAARDLAARRAEVGAPASPVPPELQRVRSWLLEASRATPPPRSPFDSGEHERTELAVDAGAAIQAAAAAALLECEQPAATQAELLPKLLHHDDAAAVALGIARWASLDVLADLTKAAQDARPEVAQAATTALGKLRGK